MKQHLRSFAVLLSLCCLAGTACTPLQSDRDLLDDEPASSSLWKQDKFSETIAKTSKQLVGKGESPPKARELFAEGSRIYEQTAQLPVEERADGFLEAAKIFQDAAVRWPDSALEQDALFMSGESYFFADSYPKANHQYELLLKKYPNSKYLDKVEARRFSIAQYWLSLQQESPQSFWSWNLTDRTRPRRDTFGEAVRIFDRIRIDDPTGKLADDATLAAGNAYFASAKYLDADSFFTDLRKTFPSSEHQFQAHLLGVKAKLKSYQGPDYSGDPLDEAEKLIKQIHKQFPSFAAEEREYLERAYAEVRFKKAEREWKMASYYDRRGEHRAARFYYSLLVRDFEDTPYAQEARQRLGEIRDAPADPPQRLGWLVDMFDKNDELTPIVAANPGDTTVR